MYLSKTSTTITSLSSEFETGFNYIVGEKYEKVQFAEKFLPPDFSDGKNT